MGHIGKKQGTYHLRSHQMCNRNALPPCGTLAKPHGDTFKALGVRNGVDNLIFQNGYCTPKKGKIMFVISAPRSGREVT